MQKITFSLAFLCLLACNSNKPQSQKNTPVKNNDSLTAEPKFRSYQLKDDYFGRATNGSYIVYHDSTEPHHNIGTIKSLSPTADEDFATILTYAKPERSLGKRVMLSGWVKSKDIKGWAGLWMRVDPKNPSDGSLSFDNMYNRPIKGTLDWKKFDIVLDVPKNSNDIVYGVLLDGNGQVWIDSLTLQIVGNDIPVTDLEATRNVKKL